MAGNKGTFSVTAVSAQKLAADDNRDEIIIQYNSGDAFYLAFGEDAADVSGIKLDATAVPVVVIQGVLAQKAIHAVCAAEDTAVATYQEVPR